MMKFNLFSIFIPKIPTLGTPVDFFKAYDRYYIRNLPVKTREQVMLLEAFPTDSPESSQTVIKSLRKKQKGYHDYKLSLKNKTFIGEYIEIDKDKRNKGLGESLKLASIIEMNANNLNKMSLYSLPEAIKFHSKFGFMPDIKNTMSLKSIFKEIVERNEFKNISDKAARILEALSENIYPVPAGNLEKYNNVLAVYIKRCITENRPIFDKKINMVLTKDKIKAHSDFYNKLFEKHGINYRI